MSPGTCPAGFHHPQHRPALFSGPVGSTLSTPGWGVTLSWGRLGTQTWRYTPSSDKSLTSLLWTGSLSETWASEKPLTVGNRPASFQEL